MSNSSIITSAIASAAVGFFAGRSTAPGEKDSAILSSQLTSSTEALRSANTEISYMSTLIDDLRIKLSVFESDPAYVNSVELAVMASAIQKGKDRIVFLTEYIRAELGSVLDDVESYKIPLTSALHVDETLVYRRGSADPWLFSGPNGDIRARGTTLIPCVSEIRFLDVAAVQQIVPLTSSLAEHPMSSHTIFTGKRFVINAHNPQASNLLASGLLANGTVGNISTTDKKAVPGWTLIEFDPSVDLPVIMKLQKIGMSSKIVGGAVNRYTLTGEEFSSSTAYTYAYNIILVRKNVMLVQAIISHAPWNAYAGMAANPVFTSLTDVHLNIRSVNLIHMPMNLCATGYTSDTTASLVNTFKEKPVPGTTFVL